MTSRLLELWGRCVHHLEYETRNVEVGFDHQVGCLGLEYSSVDTMNVASYPACLLPC